MISVTVILMIMIRRVDVTIFMKMTIFYDDEDVSPCRWREIGGAV